MTEATENDDGGPAPIAAGLWTAHPTTGIVTLSEESVEKLVNTDSFDRWYIVDPDPISSGSFAEVYYCRHRITGEEFAAKFSCRRRRGDCTADILHEIAICDMLRPCPKTIRLHDAFKTESHFILVMELAPGGDLHTILDKDSVPYERDVISFLKQLLEGLVYMHDRNIVHLDIKPQNLVLMGDFPDCALKLCDFDTSRILTPGYEVRGNLGTLDYIAPEVIQYEPITTKTDMWSLGVLTYTLLTGFLPFGGETEQETLLDITWGELDFPEELFEDISAHAIDFIKQLLIRQPRLRPSARECLDHPWMKADMKNTKVNISPVPPLPCSSASPTAMHNNITAGHSKTLSSLSSIASQSFMLEMLDELRKDPLKPSFSLSSTSLSATPNNLTPTALTPVSSSPRDIGLPPVHPTYRPVNSNHSSTSSLYRGSSRHNLERIRGLSKSREVLIEKLQMANQKRALSRSRDRLVGYSFSRSREELFLEKNSTTSYEGLFTFPYIQSDECVFKSCSNIFLPFLSMLKEENSPSSCLHKCFSSTDGIDNAKQESKISPRQSIFNSSFSIDESNYNVFVSRYGNISKQYNEIYQSEVNSSKKHTSGGSTEPGGNQNDSRNKTNDGKVVQTSRKNYAAKTEQPKNSRNAKKKNQPKNKEKPLSKVTKKSQQIQKDKKFNDQPRKRTESPEKRRGSVSHVEQRLQERHERLEKQRKAEKSSFNLATKKGNVSKEISKQNNKKSKKSKAADKGKNRQTLVPVKGTDYYQKNGSSNSTPTSSLESVKECPKKPLELKVGVKDEAKKSDLKGTSAKVEIDEAYVSLEETFDDGNLTRSSSVDSSMTVLADSQQTVREDIGLDSCLTSLMKVGIETNNNVLIPSKLEAQDENENIVSSDKADLSANPVKSTEPVSNDTDDLLSSIREEEEDDCKYVRSTSTCSDVGSMLSETSDLSCDKVSKETPTKLSDLSCERQDFRKRSDPLDIPFIRSRSKSVQPEIKLPFKLSRSNSVHLDTPISGVPRPWGEVCDGSFKRAIEMFNFKPSDIKVPLRGENPCRNDKNKGT